MSEEKIESVQTDDSKVEASSFAQTVDHPTEPQDGENSSGMHGSVPPEIMGGWNWGGCLLGWIWGIGHSVWIALLGLIVPWPIMEVILGIKGNEWAWQNRRFESVEHFKEVQRKWTIWGIIIIVIGSFVIVGIMVAAVLVSMSGARDKAREASKEQQKTNDQIKENQSKYDDNWSDFLNNTENSSINEL